MRYFYYTVPKNIAKSNKEYFLQNSLVFANDEILAIEFNITGNFVYVSNDQPTRHISSNNAICLNK